MFWDGGQYLAGAAAAAGSGLLFLGLVPGLVSRRLELGADRKAAELLGDRRPLEDALQRLAELKAEPAERDHLTHPSIRRRIAALRVHAR